MLVSVDCCLNNGKYKFLLHVVSMVKIVVWKGGGSLLAQISGGMGASPTNDCGCQKTRLLGYHVALFAGS